MTFTSNEEAEKWLRENRDLRNSSMEEGSLDSFPRGSDRKLRNESMEEGSLDSDNFNWIKYINPKDSNNVAAFQQWWNVRHSDSDQLAVDGIFGQNTMDKFNMYRDEIQTVEPEVDIIDNMLKSETGPF